jgi:hypothetical protein
MDMPIFFIKMLVILEGELLFISNQTSVKNFWYTHILTLQILVGDQSDPKFTVQIIQRTVTQSTGCCRREKAGQRP